MFKKKVIINMCILSDFKGKRNVLKCIEKKKTLLPGIFTNNRIRITQETFPLTVY